MAESGTTFPAFIRATFVDGPDGFPRFESEAVKMTGRVSQQIKSGLKKAGEDGGRALGEAILGAAGSLNLDTAGLRRAAAAATEQATELRKVAQAAELASIELGQTNSVATAYSAATRAAAIAAEEHARALTADATAAEQLAAAMARAGVNVNAIGVAQGRSATGAAGNRMAYVQLGQQVQDFAVQVQGGQSALVAFTQQASQAAFVAQGLGGTAGSVAKFFAGPWGTALVLGVGVLGPLVAKLIEGGSEAEKMKGQTMSLADALGSSAFATDTARKALADYNAEQGRARDNAERMIKINLDLAKSDLEAAKATREKIRAQLDFVLSNRDDLANDPGGAFAAATVLRSRFGVADEDVKRIDETIRNLGIQDAVRDAAALNDPLKAINNKYDDLVESAKALTAAGQQNVAALREQLAWYEKLRKAETDAVRDRQQQERRSGSGALAPVTLGEVSGILRDRFGAQITSTTGGRHTRNSLHYAGRAVDFVPRGGVGSITKEQVRQVLEEQGINIRELLGPGDKDHGDHFHVGFARARRDGTAIDEAQERRAKAVADAIEKAQRAAEELDDALARLRGRFDPAAAAAERYADTLVEIARLQKAGKLTEAQALDYSLTASAESRREEERRNAERYRAIVGDVDPSEDFRAIVDSIDARLESSAGKAADLLASRLVAGAVDAADVFSRLLGPQGSGFANAFGRVQQTTPNTALRQLGTAIFGAEQTKAIGKAIGIAVRGAELGREAGSLVLGRGGSRLGSELGGALGSSLGKPGGPLAKGLESVFKGLGDFAGPLGSIAGGLLGGLIGGALKTVPRASATIGGSGGSLQVAAVTGTSKALRDQATSSADSAIATLQQIADQFGVGIDASRGSVSIGSRNGKFRVDTSGRGITKTKKGAIDFGEDGSAAIQAATLDLIRDGVLVGLRRGSQALLQNAKDLQVGLQKALKFESVFTRLKEIEDPVGAALDAVDKEFGNLRRTFEEAGASAAEYAQLEKLYGLQRVDAIKQAGQAMTATLKDLVDELKTGDNGLSLRDRLSAAIATYDPLRDQLRAGTLKDFDAYAQAARTVLDIERQLGGSQDSYFARFNEVTSDSKLALDRQQALIDAAAGRPPALGGSNDNAAPVVSAIDKMSSDLVAAIAGQVGGKLDAVNANLGLILAGGSGGGGGRGFEFRYANNF